ncbi:hypothetical protein GCM10009551_056150 [Nocardiopsis tropica]
MRFRRARGRVRAYPAAGGAHGPDLSAVAVPGSCPGATVYGGVDVQLAYPSGLDDGARSVAVELVPADEGLRGGRPRPGRAAPGFRPLQPGPPLRGLVGQDPHEEVSGSRGDLAGEHARGDDQEELEERGGAEVEGEFPGRLRQL